MGVKFVAAVPKYGGDGLAPVVNDSGSTPATGQTPATAAAIPLTDDQIAQGQELLQQLEAAQQQLDNAKEYSQYLSMEDQAKIQMEAAILNADHVAMSMAVETGKYDPNATPQVDMQAVQEQLLKMEPGWNDMLGKVVPEADGTINLATSGVYDPTNPRSSNALAFVVPEAVTKIVGRTVGQDVLITCYKKNPATNQDDIVVGNYTLKNMAVRPEKIYIYGAQKSSGLVVDLARVVRVSNGKYGQPFGETNGFVVWGTNANDKIIGSEGDDILIGAGANDALYGMGGNDLIYGDSYGVGQFSATDGNDLLDGGDGADTLREGGGSKGRIIRDEKDSAAEGEILEDTHFVKQTAEQVKGWVKADKWTPDIDPTTGEITLNLNNDVKDNNGGTIELDLPPGFTMGSGSVDPSGQACIFTAVGIIDGKPQTLRLRINDFFNPGVKVTLNVHGNDAQNILDFHNVTLTGNAINLYGKGEDDVLLAPKTYLDSLGVDLNKLGKGTYTKKQLENVVLSMRSPNGMDWGGYNWVNYKKLDDSTFINPDGEIELDIPPEELSVGHLAFDLPPGFTDSVLMVDKQHPKDLKLILISRTGNHVDQAVVRIKDGAAKVDVGKITMNGIAIKFIDEVPQIFGGGGHDTLFGSSASVDFSDTNGDTVIEGSYNYTYNQQPITTETTTDKKSKLTSQIAGLENKLATANADLSDLNAQKADMEKNNQQTSEAYANLLKEIDTINETIATLTKQKEQAETDLKALDGAQ